MVKNRVLGNRQPRMKPQIGHWSGIAGSHGNSMFNLLRSCQTVVQCSVPSDSARAAGFQFLYMLASTCYCLFDGVLKHEQVPDWHTKVKSHSRRRAACREPQGATQQVPVGFLGSLPFLRGGGGRKSLIPPAPTPIIVTMGTQNVPHD